MLPLKPSSERWRRWRGGHHLDLQRAVDGSHEVFSVVAATASAALVNGVVILDGRVIDPEAGLDAVRNLAIEGDKNVGDM